jgi:transposase
MPHIAGHDRSQLLLLPESLDDYVGPENPVRFIEAFVEGLDLPAAGFARVEPEETGRPGYRPADLLKLYIYGDLNRIRSSRRLEAETHRNVEVIWLLRHLKPNTISENHIVEWDLSAKSTVWLIIAFVVPLQVVG